MSGISWPEFREGEVLGAGKLMRFVRGCRELERLARSCQIQGGVGYTFHRGNGGTTLCVKGGGRGRGEAGEPFTLKRVKKDGTGWRASFWPGIVTEVHPGGVRRVRPYLGEGKMDEKVDGGGGELVDPTLSVKDEDKVFLYLERGGSHDCITRAVVTTEEECGERGTRILLGEFRKGTDEEGEETMEYEEKWSGNVNYAQSSLNEGWRVLVGSDADGAPERAWVRMGDVYANGRCVYSGGGEWAEVEGVGGGACEFWAVVVVDDEGKNGSVTVRCQEAGGDVEGGDDAGGRMYKVKLASVSDEDEPCVEDGNGERLIVVEQFVVGVIVVGWGVRLRADRGIEVVKGSSSSSDGGNDGGGDNGQGGQGGDAQGGGDAGGGDDEGDVWVVKALIEDAAEASTADHSLIYEDDKGSGSGASGGSSGSSASGGQGNEGNQGGQGGGNDGGGEDDGSKGRPYRLKLLCCSDGSVDINDEDGRLRLSAQRVEPGDGLEWAQEEVEGVMQNTNVLRVRIDSVGVGSGADWRRLNLSVSADGLRGEVGFDVDSTRQVVGGVSLGLGVVDKKLRLEVDGGGVSPDPSYYSFVEPLYQYGTEVGLSVNDADRVLADGTKLKLDVVGGKLDLIVDTRETVTPGGGGQCLGVDSRWTVLGCDSDHAVRLQLTADSRLYIQLGQYLVSSRTWVPVVVSGSGV